MGVMRIHKTANYTVMSNYHFKEKNMSLKAKGLLSLMLSLPDDWVYSIRGLVKLSKDGKDGVMSALAELEDFGYLTRTRTTNEKGQFNGVEYDIFEEPQAKNPNAEKQNEEKQNSDNANSENSLLLNTNPIKYLSNEIYNELNTNGDEELAELYKDYIVMRKAIQSPLTEAGFERLYKKCKKLSYGNANVEKLILENAVINNWKDVYLPRESELSALNQRFVGDFKELFGLE